jgi:c-di-GMP-binding flagellar brake protein YcgR
MEKKGKERRQYQRVLFTVEDGIVGVFNPPGKADGPVQASVMDISKGGVKLLFKPILKNRIMEGDRIILSEIKGQGSSPVIVNIDTEVKWISEDELSKTIGVGVEFLNVRESEQQQIDDLTEFWYMQKLERQ